MLIASAKICVRWGEGRGAFRNPAFMGYCWLLVTHVSLIYQVDEFILFVSGVAERNQNAVWIQDFLCVLLVLIKEMKKGGECKIFLCYPSGLETSHEYYYEWGDVI